MTEKYGHMEPGEGASICFLLHILLLSESECLHRVLLAYTTIRP